MAVKDRDEALLNASTLEKQLAAVQQSARTMYAHVIDRNEPNFAEPNRAKFEIC